MNASMNINRKPVNPTLPLTIGLKWDEIQGQEIDLDLQCILMNELGQIEEAVFYNELSSKISKIRLSEDSKGEKVGFDEILTIELATCPFQVKYLAILICSFKGQPLSYVESSQMQVIQSESIIYESSIGANGAGALSVFPCIFERYYDGTWSLIGVEESGVGKTFLDNEDLIKKGLVKVGFDHALFEECKNWKGGKSFNLQKNHALVLPSSMNEICVGLGWDTTCDIDSSVLLFGNQTGQAAQTVENTQQIDNIYYGHKRAENGSVVHSGDNLTGIGAGDDEVITIYLDRLAPNVTVAWAVITIFTSNFQFDDVKGAYCRLFDSKSKKEFCRYNLSKNKDNISTGNIMCSISRCQQGTWSVSPKGFYTKGTKTSANVSPIIQEIMVGNFSNVRTIEQIYPNLLKQEKKVVQPPPIKPQNVFQITMEKATGLASFDSNGLSDPYISFKINGKRQEKTKIIYKELNPVWNHTLMRPLFVGDRLEFKLLDHDAFAFDDYMGSCYLTVQAELLNSPTFSIQLKVLDKDQIEVPKFTGTLFVNFKKVN